MSPGLTPQKVLYRLSDVYPAVSVPYRTVSRFHIHTTSGAEKAVRRSFIQMPSQMAMESNDPYRFVPACLLQLLLLISIHTAATAQYRLDHWAVENGLPQNYVRDLVQTRDGYLWLSTQGGLARFDGQRMTVFTKVTRPEILSNRFTMLHEDRAGNLWIGTEEGGVLRYRDGAFTGWSSRDGLPGNYVDFIDEDESGNILVFTDRGAVQWRNGKFIKLSLSPDDAGRFNSQTYIGGFGRYLHSAFRAVGNGYEIFYHGRWEHLPIPSGQAPGSAFHSGIRSLTHDTRGRLWFNRDRISGYFERRGGKWTATLTPPLRGIPFYLDQQGRYWTTYKSSVALEKDGKATLLPIQGVHWSYRVLEDREGSHWLGTYDQGLYRVTEQAISFLELPGPPTDRYVYPLLEDRTGNVWISAGQAGLTRYAGGRLERFSLAGADHVLDISSFFEEPDGSLLVGTFLNGLTRFRNGVWRRDNELSARIRGRVDTMIRDRQGAMWFGGLNGLDRRDASGRWTHYGPDNGLPSTHVKTMLEDSAGGLWIGGYGCLALWRDGRLTAWTKNEGLIADRVISLYQDAEQIIWAGTSDGGLYRIRLSGNPFHLTRYTTRDGLHSDSIKQIFEDDRGYFWLGSEQGIFRVRKRELMDFADGRNTFLTSVVFGKADGMTSVECIGGFQPAGFKARDGRLWFPTQGGVAVVDPSRVTVNAIPPPVALEDCLLDRHAVDWRNGVRINPGQSSLEISYTGLSLDKAEKVRFRYRLEGLDPDWIEAGTRRTAYFSHIPPGEYTFKVIAATSDGIWNTEGQSLRISVLPPFYRTWWFVTFIALVVIGLTGLAFGIRLRQLNERNQQQEAFSRELIESQEAERKRIAAELHDSLGQNLIIIKNNATMGMAVTESSSPVREQLLEITDTAVQSLKEVREIINNLRPHQLETVGLTRTLEFMCEQAANAAGFRLETEIPQIDGLLAPEDEVTFYRLVQEGINNIIKHAGAGRAAIRIGRRANVLALTIEDDGRGFDPSAARGQSGPLGFGLKGLAERARQLGGTFQIQSAPGRGTKIQINIPGKSQ